jgi:hypothetical protein
MVIMLGTQGARESKSNSNMAYVALRRLSIVFLVAEDMVLGDPKDRVLAMYSREVTGT